MSIGNHYTGYGWTLEEAVRNALDQIGNRQSGELELGMSRIVDLRIQRNGIVQAVSFRAIVEEDLGTHSWQDPPRN